MFKKTIFIVALLSVFAFSQQEEDHQAVLDMLDQLRQSSLAELDALQSRWGRLQVQRELNLFILDESRKEQTGECDSRLVDVQDKDEQISGTQFYVQWMQSRIQANNQRIATLAEVICNKNLNYIDGIKNVKLFIRLIQYLRNALLSYEQSELVQMHQDVQSTISQISHMVSVFRDIKKNDLSARFLQSMGNFLQTGQELNEEVAPVTTEVAVSQLVEILNQMEHDLNEDVSVNQDNNVETGSTYHDFVNRLEKENEVFTRHIEEHNALVEHQKRQRIVLKQRHATCMARLQEIQTTVLVFSQDYQRETTDHNEALQRIAQELELFDQLYRFYNGEVHALDEGTSTFNLPVAPAPEDAASEESHSEETHSEDFESEQSEHADASSATETEVDPATSHDEEIPEPDSPVQDDALWVGGDSSSLPPVQVHEVHESEPEFEEYSAESEDHVTHEEHLTEDHVVEEHTDVVEEQTDVVEEHTDAVEEHTETVEEHTDAVEEHTETVEEHTETVEEHTETVEEHTVVVQEHTDAVEEHTETVEEHTDAVEEHTETVEEHTETVEEHTETVEEHADVVEEHTDAVEEHTETVEEHTETVEEHTEGVEEHTEVVQEHTETVEEHTETVEEHTETVEEHTETVEEHTETVEEHLEEEHDAVSETEVIDHDVVSESEVIDQEDPELVVAETQAVESVEHVESHESVEQVTETVESHEEVVESHEEVVVESHEEVVVESHEEVVVESHEESHEEVAESNSEEVMVQKHARDGTSGKKRQGSLKIERNYKAMNLNEKEINELQDLWV